MVRKSFSNLILGILTTACFAAAAVAQEIDPDKPDTVIVRSDQNEGIRRIRGQITRWEGSALTLSVGPRVRQIDNSQIVDIETRWSKASIEARQQMAVNAFARSMVLLERAVADESRPWAQAMLRSDLVRAMLATDQGAAACKQFLMLLEDDPNTRFLNVAPLAWADGAKNPTLVNRAGDWFKSEIPLARLLGASYLIGTAQQESALQALELLSRDLDERIAGLATAQIWRAQKKVDIRLIEKWIDDVSAMPKELRPGPYYVLARHLEGAGRDKEAVTMWMRLPILYDERPDLAAAALYRVARLLHNTDSNESATIVQQELTRTFPDSMWARHDDLFK